jgi:Zn ribbon nucleic-acid-binding protein
MSGARECITNTIPDVPSCVVHGAHRSYCDGFARRYDVEARRTVITDRPCRGCVPAPAEVGHLCYSCLTKLDAALTDVDEVTTFMWEDGSNGVRDSNDGGSSGVTPNWTMTESRVMVSWIVAAMRNALALIDHLDEDAYWTVTCTDGTSRRWLARAARVIDLTYLDGAGTVNRAVVTRGIPAVRQRIEVGRDDLIATPFGAEAAVRMTKTIQRAYAKFPLVEPRRRIAGIRCPNCSRSRLMWSPPLMFRGDVTVTCDECGHVEPQSYLERFAEVQQAIAEGRQTA